MVMTGNPISERYSGTDRFVNTRAALLTDLERSRNLKDFSGLPKRDNQSTLQLQDQFPVDGQHFQSLVDPPFNIRAVNFAYPFHE